MSFQLHVLTRSDLDTAVFEVLAALFDGYRMFYGQPSDLARAAGFLRERIERGESSVLIALADDGAGLGFTQLYPLFSSVRAARIEILNDLFVAPGARGQGVGRALLRAAEGSARARGAVRLVLSTALDNHAAQALYAAAGWTRDDAFVEYAKPL
jgi:GNAT superfamily N-acetyltransferase